MKTNEGRPTVNDYREQACATELLCKSLRLIAATILALTGVLLTSKMQTTYAWAIRIALLAAADKFSAYPILLQYTKFLC